MPNDIFLSRRAFAAGLVAGLATLALPRGAMALTVDQARALVDKTVADINSIISSGKGESAMLGDFEKLFARYADVPTIARSALGPAARQASKAQMSGFTKAFQGYISRKYGRRFREFIGGRIEVNDAKALKSYYEVITTAYLSGEAPFEVRWHVSDKAGKSLFFNIIIEGVNMLASERTEIGALLDQRGGDLDRLITDMAKL
ncbi:ABC transporter substrate-binding protein [Tabrizicola piscis]|jgi:phospholipid transport system substrate-binding protein|uniref:ABC transporter substrate-binding protein n=1 Tax=Tabrizicola piscis TaxID=2494374 RepID=A0A3S8U5S7_9RHOB|nr:ABC transporter substrate-binding protein [Tabrizicola piscis]AZL58974.1 ABC transporter substrate-binding protein [Tabrizicola piscis]